ncbi:MAG: C40 family peptidase [Bacteroidales bacterium]|nr:C40 family peptidase [Bacteroidales bacterium]
MKNKSHILFACLAILLCATSCKGLKTFLSKDLEDEDYIIGALYADEYVEETVAVAPPAKNQKNEGKAKGNIGIEITPKDNPKLYSAIESWYGTPYKIGGCSTTGVDCSCFVNNIFQSVYGIQLHRTANDMLQDVSLISREKLREGDLVFFTNSNGKVSHVGIYLKDGLFVHSSTSKGVMISPMSNSYWASHFYKGGRHKSVQTKY